jgi:hypothetical protein
LSAEAVVMVENRFPIGHFRIKGVGVGGSAGFRGRLFEQSHSRQIGSLRPPVRVAPGEGQRAGEG